MPTKTEQHSSAVPSDKLEGHAASAAYIVTRDTSSSQSSHPILDANGKLSSAGAATSLKHARAQDLPSFPSQGGVSLASAGAAASLADSNKKSFEHWKPGEIPAANKAALQAKDYEMDPLWKPEMSRAGSKAAVLAHRNTTSPDAIYTPRETAHGMSAAGHALDHNVSPEAITNREPPVSDHRKALMAATGAMAGSRRRAGSAPIKPQTQGNTTNWALQAATSSHRAQTPTEFTTGDPGFEAARIQNLAKNNVNRQMYGSAPPVSIEVAEKNRQNMLRASAVAMARKMYAVQQSQIDEASAMKHTDNVAGARAARNRASSDTSAGIVPASTNKYENLEEAARKLAQERLAKLHDEQAEYRQYYGATTSPPKSKLSMSIRNRRRTNSYEQDSDDSDQEQSRKIKAQMSIFHNKLAEVDTKKRQADRDALLDAAHKNVTKQMNALDEKVFKDTGKASPQQREIWERQARERAQRDSDERMMNVGKVHIGGGKYMDQSEVEAIAKARLQPTLDDITEKAEKQRARDEEIRMDQERQKAEAERDKQRQAEIRQGMKETQQMQKEEERARRAEEKRAQREEAAAAKEKRQAEVAAEKEKARLEKEGKRKSKDNKPGRFTAVLGKGGFAAGGGTAATTGATVGTAADSALPHSSEPERFQTAEERVEAEDTTRPAEDDSPKSPDTASPDTERTKEPTSPLPLGPNDASSPKDSKVKSWFKSHFRSTSKSEADQNDHPTTADTTAISKDVANEDKPRSDSVRDVAMAGRTTESEDMYGDSNNATAPVPGRDAERSPSISSLSSYDEDRAGTRSSPLNNKASTEQPAQIPTERPSSDLESDGEPRGRKGFGRRLLSKVKRDKPKSTNDEKVIPEEGPTIEQQAASMPDSALLPEQKYGIDNVKPAGTTGNDDAEEAKDTFAEEKLAPPPKLNSVTTGVGGSPRGSRERSRFTENL